MRYCIFMLATAAVRILAYRALQAYNAAAVPTSVVVAANKPPGTAVRA
jgi:hypothetical protein